MSQPVGQSGPVETMMAADAASRMFGIELLEHGPGWARTQLTVRDDMVNGHDICHGAVIFALVCLVATVADLMIFSVVRDATDALWLTIKLAESSTKWAVCAVITVLTAIFIVSRSVRTRG